MLGGERRGGGAMRLRLRGISALGRVGVQAWEREAAQPLIVDVTAIVAAPAADRLAATVDYGAIAAAVREQVATGAPALVETLAIALAEHLVARFGLRRCVVTVHKPWAAASVGAADVAIVAAAAHRAAATAGSEVGP
jgi:dihydroneopterin aldolase